ncbi:o-succinylbenzoate synthase [Algoriphagus sp. AK58]|uniref:o-succinylbenzoate synthase n=1 Tax=Algoriphagus sp. AK58 TaxID=1406877 RepID=UPI00164FB1D5|nr:o-succinylbenzoate synthase [Algoriphagus sp. AK58]MBC6367400.1 o-succinylbenzoate synthase [Algoriphagus sp. AK58]
MHTSSTIKFSYTKRNLIFRFDAGTSRGVLKTREVFWIKARLSDRPEIEGWGEAAPLVGLSPDFGPDFETKLSEILLWAGRQEWPLNEEEILEKVRFLVPFSLPSIRFGLETALLDLMNGGIKKILNNDFFDHQLPIPINGLIWMGDREFMLKQIDQKLAEGFDCIKMKIGAIDFEQEIGLLKYIRERFSPEEMVLRVDANGAFSSANALEKLRRLSELSLHSIEQPIPAGQWNAMKDLCQATPLPIALDEELIGVQEKEQLLDTIQPQHIILKPTLVGGILETKEWIRLAEERGIGWWMTSALESNIGLNAISQLASSLHPSIPQGLGTGKLYHNNLESPLEVHSGKIHYNPSVPWENPD